MSSASSAPPARASSRGLVLAIVALAQFMVVLDATVVNVALPSIQSDLGFSPGDLQWVVNGYTLLFGGFLLLGGRAADLFGRRRLFLAGIALFTAASLVDGLAGSPAVLIAARAAQGLGAALVSPAAMSIITTTFTEPAERTRALGVWGAIAGGGGAFGLLLGGILTDALSWEWNFFINVPIGLATLVAARRFVPESRVADRSGGFDLAGAVLVTGGLVLLTYAIVKAQDFGWGDARTIGMGAAAFALLGAFLALERRRSAPLVRLELLRVPTLATANAAMLLVVGALFAMFFFGSLYFQEIKGYSPLESGVAFLPLTAGIIGGSMLAQQAIRRFGVKPVLLSGLTVAGLGLLWLTGLSPSSSYAGGMLPGLVLIAIGMGNTFVPLTLAATANIADDDQGLASGVFNTAQQVGGALGLAVLSTIALNVTAGGTDPQALVDGYTTAFAVGAVLILAGVALAATFLRRRDIAHLRDGVALAPA